ncbi:MAG: peptidoglycan-binding protein LysM [Gelidibacter sp.]
MKKQIIIATLALGAFVIGTNNTQAQIGTTSNPVSTTVNIILSDVISIDAGSVASEGIVDFNYVTTADYNTAKNVTVENSLIVTSSKNFDVKVKAEGENFTSGTDVIPVSVLQVKAVSGGTMVGTLNQITLSNANQVLVSNATLGAKKSLSIDYSISAEKAQTVLLGKAPGTYTQKVTYTATAL